MRLFNGGVSGAALVCLVALGATACGGGDDKPSGSSADFGALQKEYASPSGTLQASDKAALIAALNSQSASGGVGVLSAPRVASGKGPGPHVLADPGISCGAATSSGVTCTCPGGGSLVETIGGGASADNVSGTAQYKMCDLSGTSPKEVLDGTLSFNIASGPPSTEIYHGSIDETITPPGTTTHVDIDYALIDSMLTYDVQVSDGNVLISASANWDTTTDSGSFTVTTKDGTTSCTLTNGAGTCTGVGGTVTFS